jgi:hypothetical protein
MPAIWTLASADTWVLTGTAIAFAVLTAYDDDGVYDDGLDCSNLGLRSPASQVQLGGCAYLAEGSPNASARTAFCCYHRDGALTARSKSM